MIPISTSFENFSFLEVTAETFFVYDAAVFLWLAVSILYYLIFLQISDDISIYFYLYLLY